jgi:hypothetical protein
VVEGLAEPFSSTHTVMARTKAIAVKAHTSNSAKLAAHPTVFFSASADAHSSSEEYDVEFDEMIEVWTV